MIGTGRFEAQVNECGKVLRQAGLLETTRNHWTTPAGFRSLCRNKTYLQLWRFLYENRYFDYRLSDSALLLFHHGAVGGTELTYSYYESPYDALAYADFVEREIGEPIGLVGDALREEYETYVSACDVKGTVTPVRYDYDPCTYRPGVHPASHVHLGFESNVRVGTRRLFHPVTFVLLVIRQCYPNAWLRLLDVDEGRTWAGQIRDALAEIPECYSTAADELEHALV